MQVLMCSAHLINKSSPQPFSSFCLLVLISSFGGGFVVYIWVGIRQRYDVCHLLQAAHHIQNRKEAF